MTDNDMQEHQEERQAVRRDVAIFERKPYYVSVGACQILEDPQAAAYELEIQATEEEVTRLQELFEELTSWDEAQTFHFAHTPFTAFSTDRINLGYELLLKRVYAQLYELGTEQTKSHIQSMHFVETSGGKEEIDR